MRNEFDRKERRREVMKFILDESGKSIINVEQVQAVYIHEDSDMDENCNFVSNGVFFVKCMLIGREDVLYLMTFDGDDRDKNYRAARTYLAELFEKLNGGMNCESNVANSAQAGSNFNVANHSRRTSD